MDTLPTAPGTKGDADEAATRAAGHEAQGGGRKEEAACTRAAAGSPGDVVNKIVQHTNVDLAEGSTS